MDESGRLAADYINRISRRASFLTRTTALCFLTPTLAGLLAACGERDTAGGGGTHGGATSASSKQKESWESRVPLPMACSEVAVAKADRQGLHAGRLRLSEPAFVPEPGGRPETDSWATLAPWPTLRHTIGVAVAKNVVYVAGGGSPPRGNHQSDTNEAFTLS